MLINMNILRNVLLLCGMLLLVTCQNNDLFRTEEAGASLHLTLKSLDNTIGTRGIDDLNDDGNVSEEEIIVDGRKIYRLAIFLFDGEKAIASTVLEADDQRFSNDNSEATVSFVNLDYSKTYKLYAVANFGEYQGPTEKLVGCITDVNERNVTGGLKVLASDGNVCSHSTPYPLTLQKDINLTPGLNRVSGELLRTYARVRINVRNQSIMNDLYISDLEFSQNFTCDEVDLFTEGGTANNSPDPKSSDAITPFQSNLMIPKMDDSGYVSEKTIFDSYLLESDGGKYEYTLGLRYGGDLEEIYTVNSTAINNSNNIENDAMYVIYNTNSKKYLYANGTSVACGDSYMTNGELNHNYVWKFTRPSSDKNRYRIESMGATGYYMQSSQVSTSKIPLTVNPGNSDYFTASTSSNNIRLQSTKSNYYLSVNNSSVIGNSSTGNSAQRRNNFYLYKVVKEYVSADISSEATIPIRIVDKTSGEASLLTAIHRNDFIDVIVSVTYNEKTGNVQFEVSNWDEVYGDVTFE